VLARAKGERHLNHAQRGGRRCCDVEQDLETHGRKPGQRAHERFAREHEEPAHRVADGCSGQLVCQGSGKLAHRNSPLAPLPHAATFDVAAADDEVDVAAANDREHVEQDGLIMLHVAVHHRNVGRGRCEDALDASRCEPAAIKSMDDADARILQCERTRDVGGAIR